MKIATSAKVTYSTIVTVLLAAKLANQFKLHGNHGEHLPCDCEPDCLRCVLS